MDRGRAPEFEDNWVVFDDVVAYTRRLVGEYGNFDLGFFEDGRVGVFDVVPMNPKARTINVIAEQFLIVTVGDLGGRWELGYSNDDVGLAKRIIEAAVAGRVEERSGLGRSRVVVTFEDGTTEHETGYFGCASLLVPQPGWTRWGMLRRYEGYRPA